MQMTNGEGVCRRYPGGGFDIHGYNQLDSKCRLGLNNLRNV